MAGWLPGWLAGRVLSCACMVNHFARVFTYLSNANWCFSQAVVWVFTILRNNLLRFSKLEQVLENACAGSLAGWLAGWQAGQRWLAGWLSWLCEVHFGWVFTRISDANLLTVWLAAWLAVWWSSVMCLYG